MLPLVSTGAWALRAARRLLFGRKPAPLRLDEKQLAEFASLAPWLPEELLAEFTELSRVLRDMHAETAAHARWRAVHPLEQLIEQAADLNIVYTPGKVGSRTVAATLQRHPAFLTPVRHAHFLSATGLAFNERLAIRCAGRPAAADGWRDIIVRGRWLRVLLAINRALRANDRPALVRKPFVIAGVREPIALHLSFCFESSWMYADTPDFLTSDFVRARLADDAWHRHCNRWFTDDLLEMLGIDAYARPFPTEPGWDIYENDNARVLLIRQESLTSLPDALGSLYGLPPSTFNVVTTNTAQAKPYAELYESVKNSLRICTEELKEIYALPYVRHFYSLVEIETFKSRWQVMPHSPQIGTLPR